MGGNGSGRKPMKLADKIGKKFGLLTIVKIIPGRPPMCKAKCDCGVTKTVNWYSINGGGTRSCGCLLRNKDHGPNYEKSIELYNAGKSSVEIASLLGITCQRVLQILADAGVERRGWTLTQDKIDEILADADGTKSISELSEKHGVSRQRVISVISSQGIKIDSRLARLHKYVGMRFGKLVIQSFVSPTDERGMRDCVAKCDCGTTKVFQWNNIRHDRTKSCGCMLGRYPRIKVSERSK